MQRPELIVYHMAEAPAVLIVQAQLSAVIATTRLHTDLLDGGGGTAFAGGICGPCMKSTRTIIPLHTTHRYLLAVFDTQHPSNTWHSSGGPDCCRTVCAVVPPAGS